MTATGTKRRVKRMAALGRRRAILYRAASGSSGWFADIRTGFWRFAVTPSTGPEFEAEKEPLVARQFGEKACVTATEGRPRLVTRLTSRRTVLPVTSGRRNALHPFLNKCYESAARDCLIGSRLKPGSFL